MIDKIFEEIFGHFKPYISLYRLFCFFVLVIVTSPQFDVFFDEKVYVWTLDKVFEYSKGAIYGANFLTVVSITVLAFGGAGEINKKLSNVFSGFNIGLSFFEKEKVKALEEYKEVKEQLGHDDILGEIDRRLSAYREEKNRILVYMELLTLSFLGYLISLSYQWKSIYLTLVVVAVFFIIYVEVVSYVLRKSLRSVGFAMIYSGELKNY